MKPTLGRIVHVKTPTPINGQTEHAALVTQVWSDTMINVMVFPGSGQPFSAGSIYRDDNPADGGDKRAPMTWRWPPMHSGGTVFPPAPALGEVRSVTLPHRVEQIQTTPFPQRDTPRVQPNFEILLRAETPAMGPDDFRQAELFNAKGSK